MVLHFEWQSQTMPRKGRNNKGFRVIPVREQKTVGAGWSDETVVGLNLMTVLENESYVIGAKLAVVLRDHTVGEGPMIYGFAHSDWTDSDILVNLTADAVNRDDMAEQAKLIGLKNGTIRKAGMIVGLETDELVDNGYSKGGFTKHKLGMRVGEGYTVRIWWQNIGGATQTTGNVFDVVGEIYLREI